jgi:predicted deacylase
MWRFGNGPIQRLIVAGIHGGSEMNTIVLADELITHLQVHPEIVPPGITLYILRSLNPDGEARGAVPAGRANDNGVDLNRNWPYNWQADWDRDGCWNVFPVTAGEHAASEPETFALMNFTIQHKIDALISYHSAALGIFPGGRPEYEPSVRLAEAIAKVTNYPYPAVDTGCVYTGDLTDWAAAQDIAAVDIELTNKTDTDFGQNLMALLVFLNWGR